MAEQKTRHTHKKAQAPRKTPSLMACLLNLCSKQEKQQNNLYLTAAKARHATFTPIIATWDAVFNKDSELSCKTLG